MQAVSKLQKGYFKYWADENGHYFIRFEIKPFHYPAWTFIFSKIVYKLEY